MRQQTTPCRRMMHAACACGFVQLMHRYCPCSMRLVPMRQHAATMRDALLTPCAVPPCGSMQCHAPHAACPMRLGTHAAMHGAACPCAPARERDRDGLGLHLRHVLVAKHLGVACCVRMCLLCVYEAHVRMEGMGGGAPQTFTCRQTPEMVCVCCVWCASGSLQARASCMAGRKKAMR